MSKTNVDVELGNSESTISKITKSTPTLESSNTHIHNQGIKQHPTTQQFDSSEYNERRQFFKDQTNNSNTSMHSISTSPLTTHQININNKTDSEIYAERRQFFHNRITNHNSMVTTSTITLPTSSETKGAVIVSCLLVFCTVFGMCTWFSAGAVLSQLKIVWNIDDSSATLLTLGVNFGFLIGALLSVYFNLADKYPPSKLISIGAIGAAVLNVGLLLPNVGFGVALLLRVGTGSFMALVYPMAVKVAASHFIDNRGIAVGFVVGSVGLGSASPHLGESIQKRRERECNCVYGKAL